MLNVINGLEMVLATAQQGAETQQPGGLLSALLPFILIFVIMYMVLIRPQQKRTKEHQEMVKHLKSGDGVVTAGGLHGSITEVGEQTLKVKVADNVEVELSRGSVSLVKDKTAEGTQEKQDKQEKKQG